MPAWTAMDPLKLSDYRTKSTQRCVFLTCLPFTHTYENCGVHATTELRQSHDCQRYNTEWQAGELSACHNCFCSRGLHACLAGTRQRLALCLIANGQWYVWNHVLYTVIGYYNCSSSQKELSPENKRFDGLLKSCLWNGMLWQIFKGLGMCHLQKSRLAGARLTVFNFIKGYQNRSKQTITHCRCTEREHLSSEIIPYTKMSWEC